MHTFGLTIILADFGNMHDGDGWWLMMLMMTVVWVALIAGAVWLVRELVGKHRAGENTTPERILAERLASGDISVEEYEQRRRALSVE